MLREFMGSEAASFQTNLPVDEGVSRLKEASAPVRFSWSDAFSDTEALVGSVSRSRVRLRHVRVRVRFGVAFATIFIGHFVPRSSGAVLVGRFTVAPFARAALVAWFFVVVSVMATDIVSYGAGFKLSLLVPGAVVLLWGLADVFASVARQREDMEFIAAEIRAALQPDAAAAAPIQPRPRARP